MKTDVETLSPTRVRLSIEVPFDELQPSVESAYKKIAAQVTIPGFRKGKVPPRIIDQRVGRVQAAMCVDRVEARPRRSPLCSVVIASAGMSEWETR